MRYISWLDYKDMAYNPDDYLKNVKIANFDIINHECRGYPLQGTYKGYKTLEKNYFKNFSKDDEKKIYISATFRTGREDLWVRLD